MYPGPAISTMRHSALSTMNSSPTAMKQLDRLRAELQPFLAKIPPDEREPLNTALARAQKGVSSSNRNTTVRSGTGLPSMPCSRVRLRISSRDTRHFSRNSGTAMAVVENDGTISLVNTVFLNLLEYRRDEVENRKNIFEFSMSSPGTR